MFRTLTRESGPTAVSHVGLTSVCSKGPEVSPGLLTTWSRRLHRSRSGLDGSARKALPIDPGRSPPRALREDGERALRETNSVVPPRLARVMTYANDRADYLDIRQDVANAAAAFDPFPAPSDADKRADAIIAAARRAMVRTMVRRLDDPQFRAELATALVGLVLP